MISSEKKNKHFRSLKNVTVGQYLTGQLTLSKNDIGKRVGSTH